MTSAARRTVRARAVAALVFGLLALGAALLVLPTSADASTQYVPRATPTTCDQAYGCETSSTTGTVTPACSISTLQALPGTKVTATITNIPVGSVVSLLFDGTEVAKKTATADGQGQSALALVHSAGHLSVAAASVDTSGGAVMSFNVPNVAPGKHTVVFSGAGFSCDATGGVGFTVLAASVNRGGGGSLSKTGIDVAVYLAAALALILVGWQLVRVARARRRQMARRHRSSSHRSSSRSSHESTRETARR